MGYRIEVNGLTEDGKEEELYYGTKYYGYEVETRDEVLETESGRYLNEKVGIPEYYEWICGMNEFVLDNETATEFLKMYFREAEDYSPSLGSNKGAKDIDVDKMLNGYGKVLIRWY